MPPLPPPNPPRLLQVEKPLPSIRSAPSRDIFVHLSGHAANDAAPTSRSAGNAEELARMSYLFAESFFKIEAERTANEAPPPAAFDINTLDFDGWTGKTTPAA